MLTFLRKIRRSLINSGATRKYLLYAVGEIALVVIGILIALQVNNLNENRKARDYEKKSLIKLKEEFQKNHLDLQKHIEWKTNIQNEWDEFFKIISNKLLPDEERAIRRPMASFIKYGISNSILNSLLATGKIDNLQNDSLKYMLSTWDDSVNDYRQFEEMHSNFVLNELMPFERDFYPESNNARYGYEYSLSEIDNETELYIKAYGDMVFQNVLLRNFFWINLELRRIRVLEDHMNKIILLLESETNE